jgi:Bromodomain
VLFILLYTAGKKGKGKRSLSAASNSNSSMAAAAAAAETEPEATATATLPDALLQRLGQLNAAMRLTQTPDRRSAIEWFHTKPRKNEYAGYYDVIKKPMDVKTILSRTKKAEYTSLDEYEADWALIFSNACTFNTPDSIVFQVCSLLPLCDCKASATQAQVVVAHAVETDSACLNNWVTVDISCTQYCCVD